VPAKYVNYYFLTIGKYIIIIINDSIYPSISNASRAGNKRSVVSRTIVHINTY